MAARTRFPLLHVLLLVGSALSRQLVTGQPGHYFSGFDQFLKGVLEALPAYLTEVEQANEVASTLADNRYSQYSRRLNFAVAIYSFPGQDGSSILPDDHGSGVIRVDAHTRDGAAASPTSPYCSTNAGDPPEACVESGGSLMRYFVSTETRDFGRGQETVIKRAMVFWWPKTEAQWPADYIQRWSSAIDQRRGPGYLWRSACGQYRGNNGNAGNIYASVLARCLFDAWVAGAQGFGPNVGPNSCRALLFARQESTSVSDVAGHLIQTPGHFRLKREGESGTKSTDVINFIIVMLP